MARIKIEDLPLGRPLTEEEAEDVLGRGRVRLDIEALETRSMMTASTLSPPVFLRDLGEQPSGHTSWMPEGQVAVNPFTVPQEASATGQAVEAAFANQNFVLRGTITDAQGQPITAEYTFDPAGRFIHLTLTRVENGTTTTDTYSPDGLLKNRLIVSSQGEKTTGDFQYDADGKLRQTIVTDASGTTITDNYDSQGKLRSRNIGTTIATYEYNDEGKLQKTETRTVDGTRTADHFDADGKRVKSIATTPSGAATTTIFKRGTQGLLLSTHTVHPDGTTFTVLYDMEGKPYQTTFVAPSGTTTAHLGANERVQKTVTVGSQGTVTDTYGPNDKVARRVAVDPSGQQKTTDYVYFPSGLVQQVVVTSATEIATYIYDAVGILRQSKVEWPQNALAPSSADENGPQVLRVAKIIAITDDFDAAGRLTRRSTTDTIRTTTIDFRYYATGTLQQSISTGAREMVRTDDYDPSGNLQRSHTTDLDGSQTFVFDSSGKVRQTINTDNTGLTTTDDYDANGKLTRRSIVDAEGNTTTLDIRFDGQGNLLQTVSSDVDGVTTDDYAADGHVTRRTVTDSQKRTTSTDYRYAGGTVIETTTTTPDGVTTTVFYNSSGGPQRAVTRNASGTTTDEFNAGGNVSRRTVVDTQGNRVVTDFSYYTTGEVFQSTTTTPDGTLTIATFDQGGTLVRHYTIDVQGQTVDVEYRYAPNGNLQQTITTDTEGSKTTIHYNDAGRQVQVVTVGVQGTSIDDYNEKGQLIRRTFTDTDGVTLVTEYFYDADGNLLPPTRPWDKFKLSPFQERQLNPDWVKWRAHMDDVEAEYAKLKAEYDQLERKITALYEERSRLFHEWLFNTHDYQKIEELSDKMTELDREADRLNQVRNDIGRKIQNEISRTLSGLKSHEPDQYQQAPSSGPLGETPVLDEHGIPQRNHQDEYVYWMPDGSVATKHALDIMERDGVVYPTDGDGNVIRDKDTGEYARFDANGRIVNRDGHRFVIDGATGAIRRNPFNENLYYGPKGQIVTKVTFEILKHDGIDYAVDRNGRLMKNTRHEYARRDAQGHIVDLHGNPYVIDAKTGDLKIKDGHNLFHAPDGLEVTEAELDRINRRGDAKAVWAARAALLSLQGSSNPEIRAYFKRLWELMVTDPDSFKLGAHTMPQTQEAMKHAASRLAEQMLAHDRAVANKSHHHVETATKTEAPRSTPTDAQILKILADALGLAKTPGWDGKLYGNQWMEVNSALQAHGIRAANPIEQLKELHLRIVALNPKAPMPHGLDGNQQVAFNNLRATGHVDQMFIPPPPPQRHSSHATQPAAHSPGIVEMIWNMTGGEWSAERAYHGILGILDKAGQAEVSFSRWLGNLPGHILGEAYESGQSDAARALGNTQSELEHRAAAESHREQGRGKAEDLANHAVSTGAKLIDKGLHISAQLISAIGLEAMSYLPGIKPEQALAFEQAAQDAYNQGPRQVADAVTHAFEHPIETGLGMVQGTLDMGGHFLDAAARGDTATMGDIGGEFVIVTAATEGLLHGLKPVGEVFLGDLSHIPSGAKEVAHVPVGHDVPLSKDVPTGNVPTDPLRQFGTPLIDARGNVLGTGGMTLEHLNIARDWVEVNQQIVGIRVTKDVATPVIEAGGRAKGPELHSHTDLDTGIVTAKNAAEIAEARNAGYFVVDADGVARNAAGDVLKLPPDWPYPIREGQILDGSRGARPVTADYDLAGIIRPDHPTGNLGLATVDGEVPVSVSNPSVNRFLHDMSTLIGEERFMHGPDDLFNKLGDAGNVIRINLDGSVDLLTNAEWQAYYEAMGRKSLDMKTAIKEGAHAVEGFEQPPADVQAEIIDQTLERTIIKDGVKLQALEGGLDKAPPPDAGELTAVPTTPSGSALADQLGVEIRNRQTTVAASVLKEFVIDKVADLDLYVGGSTNSPSYSCPDYAISVDNLLRLGSEPMVMPVPAEVADILHALDHGRELSINGVRVVQQVAHIASDNSVHMKAELTAEGHLIVDPWSSANAIADFYQGHWSTPVSLEELTEIISTHFQPGDTAIILGEDDNAVSHLFNAINIQGEALFLDGAARGSGTSRRGLAIMSFKKYSFLKTS